MIRKIAWFLALVCALACVTPATRASELDAKRREAAGVEASISAQGRRLSVADEQYNAARLERQRVADRSISARALVVSAEERWNRLRAQLGSRVRSLYMHPGAVADALLGARSLSDLARARAYGSNVVTADTKLVMATEKARQELLAKAKTLDGLRRAAVRKEQEITTQRSSVRRELGSLRSLRSKVSGEIATLIEEERRRELAAVQQAAAASGQTAGPDESGGGSIGVPAAPDPIGPPPPVRGSAGTAVATAGAQLGKPYEWAAAGPNSFDCSGLTMYAWNSAGVSLPHSSGAQYASLPHVSRAELRPGDLVFFGSPIHHVGIYEGGGVMINAPETGESVRRDSIGRADYVGAARP